MFVLCSPSLAGEDLYGSFTESCLACFTCNTTNDYRARSFYTLDCGKLHPASDTQPLSKCLQPVHYSHTAVIEIFFSP